MKNNYLWRSLNLANLHLVVIAKSLPHLFIYFCLSHRVPAESLRWLNKIAAWAHLSSLKLPFFIVFSSHPSGFHLRSSGSGQAEMAARRCDWYLSLVITHKTLCDPCWHMMDLTLSCNRAISKVRKKKSLLWGQSLRWNLHTHRH